MSHIDRQLVAAFLSFLVGCAAGTKTIPEKPAAQPTPAPLASLNESAPVVEGDVTFALVHGMQVLVKVNPSAEVVSTILYVRGGVRNWTAANAGIEQLALGVAASGGTESLDKDAFARKLATLGSSISAGAGNDFSLWSAKSLKNQWDETFSLMLDTFSHPAMPLAEVEINRARQLSALKHELESPDARLALAMHQLLFKGHPYENRAIGTPESVSRLTREDLLKHLAKLREARRLLLVVVGNVPAEQVIDRARTSFSQLALGSYQNQPLPRLNLAGGRVAAVEAALPTNYIEGIFPGPGWADRDHPSALVTMSVLNWRLFEEVRTKRNLSYAPASFYSANSADPRGTLYVTATDPLTTLKVMAGEVKRLQTTLVPEKELAGDKSIFLTGLLMQNEATDGQADLLGRAQLYGGDWRLARTLPERVRAVSAADAQDFAKRYIHGLQVVGLGDTAKLSLEVLSSL